MKNEYIIKDLLPIARISGNGSKVSTVEAGGSYPLTNKNNGTSLVLRFIIGKFFPEIKEKIPAKKVSEKLNLLFGNKAAVIALEKVITDKFGVKGKNGEGYNNFSSGRLPNELRKNEDRGIIRSYSAEKISDLPSYLNISDFGDIPIS
jgi:hypothetical protein